MYNKKTWHKGDVVSSSGLNNMEDGIAANDAAISEIHDPADSAIADGGIGYYDKTTLLNETIPVADWVDETTDAYAEIDVTGIELSADKKYWIVINGVATKCDYGEEVDEWFIVPIDPDTQFPAISMNGSDNYSLFLAELPTEPVSFQLIEGEAHKISNDFLQASGGGYDAVIKCNHYQIQHITAAELVKGSYDALVAKIEAGEKITIGAYGTNSTEQSKNQSSWAVGVVSYDDYGSEQAKITGACWGLDNGFLFAIASDDSVTLEALD